MTVCLVTGGSGFLGSHLVEALVAAHHAVRVVDNFTTGRLDHLARVMDAIELFPGDCSDSAFLGKAMRGVEVVFHLGCSPSPEGPRGGSTRSDGSVTLRVLTAAVQARVRRLLFASSMHVYGAPAPRPIDEADLAEPASPYGRAKLSGELACSVCTKVSGLETVSLRYFNVFGPRQRATSRYAAVIPEALRGAQVGRPAVLLGGPDTVHDLLYVGDAIHATLLAATASRVAGKTYNIARGQPTATREVVDTLSEVLGVKVQPTYAGPCDRGASNNLASVRRAEIDLGFCAATDLRQGLIRYLLSATPSSQANGVTGLARSYPA